MAKKTQQVALTSLEIRSQSGSFATASFGMSTSGQPLHQQSQQSFAPCSFQLPIRCHALASYSTDHISPSIIATHVPECTQEEAKAGAGKRQHSHCMRAQGRLSSYWQPLCQLAAHRTLTWAGCWCGGQWRPSRLCPSRRCSLQPALWLAH